MPGLLPAHRQGLAQLRAGNMRAPSLASPSTFCDRYDLYVSGAAIFILVWGVLAIVLGTLFTWHPEGIENVAERWGLRNMRTQRTRRFQVYLNRFGGVLFVLLGITFIVLVTVGVLPPQE